MKTFLLMICVALLVLVPMACGTLDKPLGDYFKANPEAGKPIAVDEDNDGIPDAYAQDLDNDGKADTDANGTIIEVAGSRDAIDGATEADTGLSALAVTLGALVPIVGVAAPWIARIKPVRRVQHLSRVFGGLVKNVQAIRDKAKADGSIDLAAMNEMLTELNGMVAGLNKAVADVKAEA